MADPIFSPDGKWMWTGSEWIPAPPSSASGADSAINLQDSMMSGNVNVEQNTNDASSAINLKDSANLPPPGPVFLPPRGLPPPPGPVFLPPRGLPPPPGPVFLPPPPGPVFLPPRGLPPPPGPVFLPPRGLPPPPGPVFLPPPPGPVLSNKLNSNISTSTQNQNHSSTSFNNQESENRFGMIFLGLFFIAVGLIDVIGSKYDFDLWGEFLGFDLPLWLWMITGYIELSLGFFFISTASDE